ncbi:regulator of G-protein signaling 20-like isoform X2 [Eriocheir sinensis]|uniref:regulator of G-protein signaling 20-like isoform X2 n=1 Tax=Eriocheir sinensis TaxID=95602 RepID=UPI0021CABA3A|nr:regulator of G-protein signaling 20-like isoform X2 [Eriocheir sinensis]XP_050718161.1 regulator of G-protein signaling 20-like isoform X2 [Eriocheir sinensis]
MSTTRTRATKNSRWKNVVARLRRGLNAKTADDLRFRKQDLYNGDNEPQPTIEEIRAWSESFEKLMTCSSGRKAFRDFLKLEFSEENILFWLACEDLKVENSPAIIEEKARIIYEDYISILSPKEVSLDSRVREIINRNMVDPTPHTFDEAQTQIYTLMHRDSYPRFINSAIYKRLAQLNNNGSSGSSRKESAT